jgi:hypothetical protein
MLSLRDELERHNVTLLIATMPQTTFETAIGRYLFLQICGAAQLQRGLDSERMTAMDQVPVPGWKTPWRGPLRLSERPRRARGPTKGPTRRAPEGAPFVSAGGRHQVRERASDARGMPSLA